MSETCSICRQERGDCEPCSDCGRPVCPDCCAEFPHHDPPHIRCETCYYRRGPRRPRRGDELSAG